MSIKLMSNHFFGKKVVTRQELLEMVRKQREDQQDAIRIVYLPAGMPNPPFCKTDFYEKFNKEPEGLCGADAEYLNKKFIKTGPWCTPKKTT